MYSQDGTARLEPPEDHQPSCTNLFYSCCLQITDLSLFSDYQSSWKEEKKITCYNFHQPFTMNVGSLQTRGFLFTSWQHFMPFLLFPSMCFSSNDLFHSSKYCPQTARGQHMKQHGLLGAELFQQAFINLMCFAFRETPLTCVLLSIPFLKQSKVSNGNAHHNISWEH